MFSSHKYFAYVRVSTARQGQTGTSLIEQRVAIERHAARHDLQIVRFYEELETAAKRGRPVFLEMLKALRQGKAAGVVMHKIDRSARNLKDWADLGELIDSGVEVHFANEAIDLQSRGGRLSADIQAVVAADYIRNLREETKKGIYGRLNQGLFPFRAVTGYCDRGAGRTKEPDPVQAPLVRAAFELYASGEWGLDALVVKMREAGLRNRNQKPVSRNGLAVMLRNPFYAGVIRIRKRNELFAGAHEAIIPQELFERVQQVLDGKSVKKKPRRCERFVFRRQVVCGECGNRRVAEWQKGWTYYRCQIKHCSQKTVREEKIEAAMLGVFQELKFSDEENRYLWSEVEREDKERLALLESAKRAAELEMKTVKERLSRLADAFMDGTFDRETYLQKKNELVWQEGELKGKINLFAGQSGEIKEKIKEFLEQLNSAYESYKEAEFEDKRELTQTIVSNFTAREKTVEIKLNLPFQMVYERRGVQSGSPRRAASRTNFAYLCQLSKNLYNFFSNKIYR